MPELVLEEGPGGGESPASPLSDRGRLTEAATRIAAERGFEALDAGDLAQATGLTVDDFHLHFENVDQCILAAFDQLLDRLLEHVNDACEDVAQWPEKVSAAIVAAFEFIAELEPVTRLFAVDAVRAGPAVVERKIASIERAADELRRGRDLYPRAAELPEAMETTIVSGIVTLVTMHLLGEEAARLPEIQGEMVVMVLTPYLGLERARSTAGSAEDRGEFVYRT